MLSSDTNTLNSNSIERLLNTIVDSDSNLPLIRIEYEDPNYIVIAHNNLIVYTSSKAIAILYKNEAQRKYDSLTISKSSLHNTV